MSELAPHVAAFLSATASAVSWSSLSPTEARARHLATRRVDAGAPDVPTVDVAVERGDGSALDLRVYGSAGGRPVLVFLHGGGWVYGDLDMADGFCRRLSVGADVVVCSVDYRLSPEHRFPLALDDACQAVAWAYEHLAGGRPVGIIGSSAGGNLTIAASLVDRAERTGRIGLQVPLCAVTDHAFDTASYQEHAAGRFLTADDMRWYWGHYLADPAEGANPLVSVLRADLEAMPAALVVTAGLDPLRDEGEAYAQRLVEAGVPTRLVRFEEMIHAFAVLSAFPAEQATLIADVATAVDAHLRS